MSGCSIQGCGNKAYQKGWCRSHYFRWYRHGDPEKGGTSPGEPVRFLTEVALPYPGDDCLIWPFAKYENGYPAVTVDGGQTGAHRHVCELAHGAPPTPEHEAAHSCGHGDCGCVNPRHLSWKTPVENQHDKIAHGTLIYGEAHGRAKLTSTDVDEILAARGKVKQRELAKTFGVTRQAIGAIYAGKNWALARHIDKAAEHLGEARQLRADANDMQRDDE